MKKNTYREHLRNVPLFANLDDRDLDRVAQLTTELDLRDGQVVMREGHLGNEMVVVVSGSLEVQREGEHIADIGPGGFAGEMSLLTNAPRNSTVQAQQGATVLHLDGRGFSGLLDDVPELAVKMLPIVAARVNDTTD